MIKKKPDTCGLPCVRPMLSEADKSKLIHGNKNYVLQEKYDGTRGLLYIEGGKVSRLVSRYCTNDLLLNFPEILKEAQHIRSPDVILDGEITFFNKKDNPFFLTATATHALKKKYRVKYMVFDVLKYNGKRTCGMPLTERLELLKNIVPEYLNHIKVVPTYTNPNEYKKIYNKIVRRKGEGVMLKLNDSKYVPNSREFWVKVKKEQTEDCIVCGITYGLGRRKKRFGALILGQYHNGTLRYVGNVGAGFTDAAVNDFYKVIMSMPNSSNPFTKNVYNVQKWVRPEIVVEVKCMERTDDGMMRLPIFLRIRNDKLAKECRY